MATSVAGDPALREVVSDALIARGMTEVGAEIEDGRVVPSSAVRARATAPFRRRGSRRE